MGKKTEVIFASAARTATSSATMLTDSTEGLFFINVTASAATPSVVFTIAGVSPAGTEYTILTSAAITGVGLTVLRVSPQLTTAANTIAKDMLPQAIKVTATHADADSITYSVYCIGMDC
jgi:hypothetical protein